MTAETVHIPVGPLTVQLIGDDRICMHHRIDGWEAVPCAVWAEIVKPGEETIDVGAYSGVYAIAAAKLGARSIAIEPLPVMANRIRQNATLNGVDVETIQAAASNKNGHAGFDYNGRVYMTTGGSLSPIKKHDREIIVKTVRLDNLPTCTLCCAVCFCQQTLPEP